MGWHKAGLAVAASALLAGCGERAERGRPVQQSSASAAPDIRPAPALQPPIDPGPSLSPSPSAEPSASPDAVPAPGSTSAAGTAIARYPPRDECARLPGFAAFRDKLSAAAKAKDPEALAALADPAVHLDYGGGAGVEELRKRLTDPRTALWSELADLLSLGCAADRGVATLPWVFARVPETADPYKTMLVLGTGVPLRETAAAKAKPMRTLDWALVEIAGTGFDPKAPYTEVTVGGARGFVETSKLRSIIDHRVIADRSGGEWRITAFIAGD
jgi:hypothetical protein